MTMPQKKRTYGTGGIEPSGRGFRARPRVGGKRAELGTFATREEAESVLRGFVAAQAQGEIETSALTLARYGERWLDRRERKGNRAIMSDRSRWAKHIATAFFASWPLTQIARRDVKRWLVDLEERQGTRTHKPIGWQTRKHAFNLLRRAFRDAVDDELIAENPCRDIEYERPSDESGENGWTYLTPEEQERLLAAASPTIVRRELLLAAVALGTGLRQGEQWCLELRDLHLEDASPWLYVRWGSPGKPPKNGRARRVPLFGVALEAVIEWVDGLAAYAPKNPLGLVFPTPRGARRQTSKTPPSWPAILRASKLFPEARHDGRRLRWHDLRHSCASALVAGWWGRAWTLIEVRDVLGHRSVTTTERYAHLAPGVIGAAAAGTDGPKLARVGEGFDVDETTRNQLRVWRDSNARPSASEAGGEPKDLAALRALRAIVRAKSERVIKSVAQRNRFARGHAVEAADATLELLDGLDAVERAERDPGAEVVELSTRRRARP